MNKKLLVAGSFFGLLAVILGAFAAHALKENERGQSNGPDRILC